jgi:general secretion pathway protein A
MYESYFGLREKPFNVTPDPRFLFATQETEEALACLTYGVIGRRGFVELTGEVGTGKTTILNLFLDWLHGSKTPTAFVFNPRLDPLEFLDYMMTDFGMQCESLSKGQKLSRLNQWLLQRYRANQTAVLVIDEAQDLSLDLLEEIRLLTNLETQTEKLLQIVLCGQPELDNKLRDHRLRQLRQRITLRCRTRALTLEETHNYVSSRLATAGREGNSLFNPEAIKEVFRHSLGVPRLINLLCDHALIAAYVEGALCVNAGCVAGIASEFDLQAEDAAGCATNLDREKVDLWQRFERKKAIEDQSHRLE